MNGTIQILRGKPVIKNPKEGGKGAIIYAHPNVILKVNEKEIKESIIVSQDDKVELIPRNDKPKRTFEIRTEANTMAAYGIIRYQEGKEIIILDSEDVHELRLMVKVKEIHPEYYTYIDIIEAIKKSKIIFGIKKEGINEVLANPDNEVLIAQGKEPQKGKDGYIEYLFFQKQEEKVKTDINERVDYKNLNEILSVKKDELIAKRTPAIQGINGKNIFGKVVKAPTPKNPSLVAGNNVRIDQKGLNAYSMVDGKPAVKGKVIHVYSVHEVFKDVDIKSGNIEFYGDVVIRGNVKEGMSIKAGHDITIYGSVSRALIQAGGEVIIKNWAIQSTIIAGAQQTELKRLYNYLAKLQGLLLQLYKGSIEVLDKLKNSGTEKIQAGKLIRIVLEKHFNEIILLLKELELIDRTKLTAIIDDKFYKEISYFIERYSIYGVINIKDVEEIKNDILLMSSMKEKLESHFKQPMNITISYAQNATIKTSGDIIITGQGCLNSNLYAGGNITMENIESSSKSSVFRGGKIECDGDVRISEIGSTGGAFTQIETGRQGKILFNMLYFNTHVQIGESKKKIEENQHRGICYRNNKGDIIIHSTS
jgi:hypothetical protein